MASPLAIDGGTPVRAEPFDGPNHDFGDADIEAVAEVLRAEFKTNKRDEFEHAYAERHGAQYGVTTNSGTSSLHTCVAAINPDPGDEIIVTPWTSGGSIIGLLFQNCVPVFADVDDTYNIDPKDVDAKITDRTRAIIAVHLFGNPCDMDGLRDVAKRRDLFLIEDCCQAHRQAAPTPATHRVHGRRIMPSRATTVPGRISSASRAIPSMIWSSWDGSWWKTANWPTPAASHRRTPSCHVEWPQPV